MVTLRVGGVSGDKDKNLKLSQNTCRQAKNLIINKFYSTKILRRIELIYWSTLFILVWDSVDYRNNTELVKNKCVNI